MHQTHELLYRKDRCALSPALPLAVARDRWQAQRQALTVGHQGREPSREDVLEAERLQDQYDRESAAIDRWAQQPVRPEAGGWVLVADRHPWAGQRLGAALRVANVNVLAVLDDVTDVLGAAVVHQPDVLLTSDRLLGGLGLEMTRRLRQLSPVTRVVVQVESQDRLPQVIQAGADAVLAHRTDPTVAVDTVMQLLPGACHTEKTSDAV